MEPLPSARVVPSTSLERRRSPWHGLTGSEALELEDAERTPARVRMSREAVARDVADEYARRAVLAIVAGDLYGAIRAANISHAARP